MTNANDFVHADVTNDDLKLLDALNAMRVWGADFHIRYSQLGKHLFIKNPYGEGPMYWEIRIG